MRISVALCTYNASKYLIEQLESILNQTKSVDEIIICDDNSKDSTHELLEQYKSQYPDLFKIFINKIQLGSIKNFEKAIQKCTGDVIFLSDQDDLWISNKVEKIVSIFNHNLNINCIATNGNIIDENSIIDDQILTVWEVPGLLNSQNLDYFTMISCFNNFATGATMAFKSSIIDNIVPFPNPKHEIHHDEWIALKTSKDNSFYFLNDKLISYRVHSSQQVGGVTYKQTKKQINYFKHVFDLNRSTTGLFYKRKLKLIQRNYIKYKAVFDDNEINNKIFLEYLLKNLKQNYFIIEDKYKKEHFIHYYFNVLAKYFKNKKIIKELKK